MFDRDRWDKQMAAIRERIREATIKLQLRKEQIQIEQQRIAEQKIRMEALRKQRE